jgi:hypothetical protein
MRTLLLVALAGGSSAPAAKAPVSPSAEAPEIRPVSSPEHECRDADTPNAPTSELLSLVFGHPQRIANWIRVLTRE